MATEPMSVHPSSAFETSSASSIPSSPRSRTTRHSVTVGESPRTAQRSWLETARRFGASLTLKLVGLIAIFIALPIVLYSQFESADRQMRDLVIRAVQDRSKLIGHALAPVLRNAEPGAGGSLNAELAKFSSDGTVLKLMVQPSAPASELQSSVGFYFVASAPAIRTDEVVPELDELAHRGILKRLGEACMWEASDEIRYRQPSGTVELLTSIIPIKTAKGCWVLTSTHTTSEFLNTSIGRPYWETRAVRVAAVIYLVLADPRHAGRDQHLSQLTAFPRGRRRDRPGPHRRLRLLPPEHRARAVERGTGLRQAGARPQAPVAADPPIGRRQCARLQDAARRHPVVAVAGAQGDAGRGATGTACDRDHRFRRSPACSRWSTPRSASTAARPT